MGRRIEFKIVGYRSKSGQVRAYKQIGESDDKFNPGKRRAHLRSFDGTLDFWVDAAKLEAAPPQSDAARERAEKKICWECGCEFTYRECRERDGDWSDSYCGC